MRRIIEMKKILMFLGTLGILLLSSCLDYEESDLDKQIRTDDRKIINYIADSIQAKKHSTGIYYQVLTANDNGKSLKMDSVVDFYYKVSLLNGTVLEEVTKQNGVPARFKLLDNAIVPEGLDYGISLMKVGEKYRFFIPSYLAYGNYYSSTFSANAIFIIEVEVIKTQTETAIDDAQLDSIDQFVTSKYTNFEKFASGLYYIDSIAGTGNKPYNGNSAKIDFVRKYLNDTTIKSVDDITLYLGYGQAVQGLEEGLKQMKQGGTATLIMPASIGFKQSLCVIPQKTRKDLLKDNVISSEVLPYSIIKYIVELKSVN